MKDLVSKAIWPATAIAVAVIVGSSFQKVSHDAVVVSQNALTASENAVAASKNAIAIAASVEAASKNAKQAVDTGAQTARAAPQLASDAAHNAGEAVVMGVANGVVQVGAATALAPVTLPLQAASGLLSAPDRENVLRVVDPTKWKLF